MAAAMFSGCPIERSFEDSIGQTNIVGVSNFCENSLFFSINNFTDEVYTTYYGLNFNQAQNQEIPPNQSHFYDWSTKGIPATLVGFDVKDDFSITITQIGQPARVYTWQQLMDTADYSDDFLHSNITVLRFGHGYMLTISFCPHNKKAPDVNQP